MPIAENLGFGLGLRSTHYEQILRESPNIGWFEIISENYISAHKGYIQYLLDLREKYPIIMHGVSLSIGGIDPFDYDYLSKLKNLADILEAPWVSDHICYTGINGKNSHDLLPIPYTEESLKHLISRINEVQDYLKRPLIFENASTYIEFASSSISEPEFLNELCKNTGCGILLDINNIYVSSYNHDFSAKSYIDQISAEYIVQYHLAGHKNCGDYIIDTHNDHVIDEVWQLYEYTLENKGFRSSMIEWDDDIPEFSILMNEINKAKQIYEKLFQRDFSPS